MSGCVDLGGWVSSVRGEIPGADGFRAAFHLAGCAACRRELDEARRMLNALAPGPVRDAKAHDEHEDLVALAAAIARREFPPGAWRCEECVDILLASIESTREIAGEAATPPLTLRPRPRAAWLWIAGGVAAAAAVLGFVAFTAPAQDWARAAGLCRFQVWRLPGRVAGDVQRIASGGALAPPRFVLPSGPIDIERDPEVQPTAPRTVSPRWETSLDVRPEFRFSGTGGRAEVFLLDGNRKFLWSATSDEAGRMPFPATESALARGATYYWKVNLLDDERVRASAYAGFTVLGDDEAEPCRADLARASSARFVEAVVAERCGLYTRAAQAFDAAARSIDEPALATRLARELRLRQGLEDEAGPR